MPEAGGTSIVQNVKYGFSSRLHLKAQLTETNISFWA